MIISLDVEKAFDNIQHPSMIKTLRTEGNFLNLINNIYKKCTGNITLNVGKLKAFLQRSGRRQGCPLLFNITLEISGNATRQKKEMKGI